MNGEPRNDCSKFCEFTSKPNNVTLRFNDEITTCENMFNGINNMTQIDLSNFHSEQVTKMSYMFNECSNLINIKFGNFKTSSTIDMECLFKLCTKITSIDVSKFDTSSLKNAKEMFASCNSLISMDLTSFNTLNVKNMRDLFAYCYNLVEVNLSSFDTSNVENMQGIFYCCYQLKYVDLPNFSASSLNHLWYTFSYCRKLIYLDLRNFKILNNQTVALLDTFKDHPETTKYCIEDSYTKEFLLGDKTVDCADLCFQENVEVDLEKDICICNEKYKFEFNNNCYQICPENTFPLLNDKYKCVSEVPENYYLDSSDNIHKKCYEKCKKCSQLGDEENNKCNECVNGYKFITDSLAIENNCYQECDYYYYFKGNNQYFCTESNNCPLQYNKLIDDKKKCIDDCKNDNEYIYEYNNNCIKICPENKKIYEKQKLCLDDCNEEQFEYENKCFDDCPKELFRIFIERNKCIDKVPSGFFNDIIRNIYKKCFSRCQICNQAGNENNNNCVECKDGYSFLKDSLAIPNNCYEKCDNYYYFDKNNKYKCVDACPPDFGKLISPKNKCIDDCKNDDEYIFEYENQCLKACPDKLKIDYETKQCLVSCYTNQFESENTCYYDFPKDCDNSKFFEDGNILINNIENFDDMLYEVILTAYPPEPGKKMMIQRPDNKVSQISNSMSDLKELNEKSDKVPEISIVDLGECEKILKQTYNISENDTLIFIKNEIKSNKSSEKNVQIEVYSPYTKEQLNLSICDEIPVNIYVPTELKKETKQIYEKMKKSGHDMFNINDAFYQDICIPFDSSNGTDMILSDRIDYIYNNEDTKCQPNCQYSNYSIESKYLSCSCYIAEEINNKTEKVDKFNAKKIYESFYEVLKYSNYGLVTCYNIILNINALKANLGSIIIIFFFFCYLICLFIFIFRGMIPLKIKLRNDIYKEPKNYKLYCKYNINNLLNPPLKRNIKNNFNKKICIYKRNKNKHNKKQLYLNINNNTNFRYSYKINSNSSSGMSVINNFNKLSIKNYNKEKNNSSNQLITNYSDFELYQLDYEQALKLDKRTLCQLYWSIMKREHLIIFTFFNCHDYNLLSIKITRFIFLLVGDMALNVFFFSDESMHKLFLTYGKYDFIQQIPQITYSTIITQIIEIFLCFLSLTDKYFYLIKRSIIKGNIRHIKQIIKCIKIKLYIYFIFIFIFFGIYWYIVSIFCGVYRNTQIPFIKDSIISFSIGLTYPIALYFISACLRICSLRSQNKKLKCVYNSSYIIPFF